MNELNTRFLLRRDRLSIEDSDSLINDTRDTFNNHIYAHAYDSDDFFDIDLTPLDELVD